MPDRAHLFVSALLGSLLLRSLYGQSEINGMAMAGLVVILASHVFDVALESIRCRRLKRISILATALALPASAPFHLPTSAAGWAEYILLPLAVAAIALTPIHRNSPCSGDEDIPRI